MKLYIRLKNGQPFEHPVTEDNLSQAFPDIDLNNLPEWVVKFTRVDAPINTLTSPYETLELSYQIVGDVVMDVWEKRSFTEAEKLKKQADVKEEWFTHALSTKFVSWTFNEDTCAFEAPVAMPNDGKSYYWSEATLSWVEVTPVVTLP